MVARDRIIFALDVDSLASAKAWADRLKGHVGYFKIGLELFTAEGPEVVRYVKSQGIKCFLDLKLHDIPYTVSGAVKSGVRLGVDIMTVHLLGGKAMITAASRTAKKEAALLGITPPKIVGVTVLTSLSQDDLIEVGIEKSLKDEVVLLAKIASECSLDVIVCSPVDIESVRPHLPKDFLVITPGIRPVGAAKGDQERIATPRGAIAAGADLLVIGRPIKDAKDPIDAARKIAEEIQKLRIMNLRK